MGPLRRGVWVIAVLAASACINADVSVCASGRVCPIGTRCAGEDGPCATDAQLEACRGVASNGEVMCSADGADGECHFGVCVAPNCGDGIQVWPEDCDGADLGGESCNSLGFYDFSPDLACQDSCVFDKSACGPGCGDGLINGPELCDGAPPLGLSCVDFGLDRGHLACNNASCAPNIENCDAIGWHLLAQPENKGLYGMWGSADDDVYAVGDSGIVLHFDGEGWSTLGELGPHAIGIHGTSASDVFVVGTGGAITHFDGTDWSLMDSGVSSNLYSVWARAPNDVFATGANKTVLHFDGSAWQPIAAYSAGTSTDTIYAVWGNASEIFVGTSVSNASAIFRFDGADWNQELLPNGNGRIRGIWGTGDELFAVGSALSPLAGGFAFHYDGSVWTDLELEVPHGLFSVTGRSTEEVYVGGFLGYIFQFDGTSWRADQPTSRHVNAIWAGEDVALAVGGGGQLLASDGSRFYRHEPFSGAAKRAVWQLSENDVVVCGNLESDTSQTIFRFDGTSWSTMPFAQSESSTMHDIWAHDEDRMVAVGDDGIWMYDTVLTSGEWAQQSLPGGAGKKFRGVWGSGPDDIYAVGEAATIVRWDGVSWEAATVPGSSSLRLEDVIGFGSSEIYAVGTDGTLLASTGDGTFQRIDLGVGAALQSIWGTSGTALHLGTKNGRLYLWDGATLEETGAHGDSIEAIFGTADNDVFAVSETTVIHYDGEDWTEVRTPASEVLLGIHGTGDTIYFTSSDGTVLTLERPHSW